MNAACKQWWKDHSDELSEWDWDSFLRVWEAAQLSVIAPSASTNTQSTSASQIADEVLVYESTRVHQLKKDVLFLDDIQLRLRAL